MLIIPVISSVRIPSMSVPLRAQVESYQQTGIDAYAGFGFAKVYLDKKAVSAINFLNTRVLPIYRLFYIPLDKILTDNGKEYTTHWASSKHEYEKFLKQNRIRHTKIKPRTPQSNGIVERFNRTLLEEFYQIAMMKKVYSSLSELQDDLDKFIYYYNFKRTNQGYRLKGKIPYQKFFDGKRKYTLPEPRQIVLFSIGKSRKCKHHLKVIQFNNKENQRKESM